MKYANELDFRIDQDVEIVILKVYITKVIDEAIKTLLHNRVLVNRQTNSMKKAMKILINYDTYLTSTYDNRGCFYAFVLNGNKKEMATNIRDRFNALSEYLKRVEIPKKVVKQEHPTISLYDLSYFENVDLKSYR